MIIFVLFLSGTSCECGRVYKQKASLYKHKKYECGKEAQFQCPHCPYKSKRKDPLKSHIFFKHFHSTLL